MEEPRRKRSDLIKQMIEELRALDKSSGDNQRQLEGLADISEFHGKRL